jgi:hypothetical protein
LCTNTYGFGNSEEIVEIGAVNLDKIGENLFVSPLGFECYFYPDNGMKGESLNGISQELLESET